MCILRSQIVKTLLLHFSPKLKNALFLLFNHKVFELNICLLTQEWPPYGCGIGSYMYNLARGLVLFGHRVTVITHDQNPVRLPGVDIHSVPLPESHNTLISRIGRKTKHFLCGIRYSWSWSAYKVLQNNTKMETIDILETADFGAWGWHFVKNGTVPVVVRCHTPSHVLHSIGQADSKSWPMSRNSRKQDYYERMQTAWADGIVSPSEALAYHLSLSWAIPLSWFSIIPNLIDAELFRPGEKDFEKNEILYVGRFDLFKGVYDLARAIVPVLDGYPKVCIRFVGMDRPAAEPYRAMGKTATEVILSLIPKRHHNRVLFTVPVPVADIVTFQQRAMCAVMPTRGFENFPYTVLEPMACGCPVVATHCGGPTEIIEDGVDGFLVSPGKPKELEKAIERLFLSGDLRKSVAQNARDKVLNKYSIDVVVPQIVQYYERIISNFNR